MRTTLLSILILLSIQNSTAGLWIKPRHYQLKRDYQFKSHDLYDYKVCEKYQSKLDIKYFVTCSEGSIMTQYNLQQLEKDSQKIEIAILEDKFLSDLKEETLNEAKKNLADLTLLKNCLEDLSHSSSCELKRHGVLLSIKEELPKLRALMAQMNSPGHYYSPTPIDRFQKDDLKHELTKIEVKDLTQNEINFLRQHTEQLKRNFQQHIYNELPVKGMKPCIKEGNNNQLELKKTAGCEKFKTIVGYRVNNLFDKQNKNYQKEYEEMISSNPMLTLINLTGEEEEAVIFNEVKSALETLSKETEKMISKISQLNGDERKDLMALNFVSENFLSENNNSRIACDLAQNLKNDLRVSELKTDLLIGAGALGAGAACAFTAGLGCIVGAGLGAEAISIGVSQHRLQQARHSFLSGFTDSQTINDREFERNLSLYLAPMSVIGAGAVVKRATNQARDSLVDARNFSFKNLDTDPFESIDGDWPALKKRYNKIGTTIKTSKKITSAKNIPYKSSENLRPIKASEMKKRAKELDPEIEELLVSAYNALNDKEVLRNYFKELYTDAAKWMAAKGRTNDLRLLKNGMVSKHAIAVTVVKRLKERGEKNFTTLLPDPQKRISYGSQAIKKDDIATDNRIFRTAIRTGPFFDRVFSDTATSGHGVMSHIIQRDIVEQVIGDRQQSQKLWNFLGTPKGVNWWVDLFDSLSDKGMNQPEVLNEYIFKNMLFPPD